RAARSRDSLRAGHARRALLARRAASSGRPSRTRGATRARRATSSAGARPAPGEQSLTAQAGRAGREDPDVAEGIDARVDERRIPTRCGGTVDEHAGHNQAADQGEKRPSTTPTHTP